MLGYLPHTKLYCDNQAAILMSNDDMYHQRTKHIDLRHHFIREALNKKELELLKIQSLYNIADILTKPLDQIKFQRLRQPLMKALSHTPHEQIDQHYANMNKEEQEICNMILSSTNYTSQEENLFTTELHSD